MRFGSRAKQTLQRWLLHFSLCIRAFWIQAQIFFRRLKQQPEKKAAVGIVCGGGRMDEGGGVVFGRQLSWENKSVKVVYYIVLVLLPHRNTNRGKVVSYPKAQANLKHISALVV